MRFVTLIVAVTGPESIWLLADRRLSYADRPPKDDGCKVMFLETTDGTAILGYAGLGATVRGTEPADWMMAVLRGRNLPLERSLGVLAEAMKKQLPRHMIRMPVDGRVAHNVIVTAFLGTEPRLYTIDLFFASDRKSYQFRYTRHEFNKTPTAPPRTPRVMIGGSGAPYLMEDPKWVRSLLRLVRANDRGKVSPGTVADHLATLNNDVRLAMTDESVGPRCIVAWRFRKGGVQNGGGAHRFYTGLKRDAFSPRLPSIGIGMDWGAVVGVLSPHMAKTAEAMLAGEPAPEWDMDEINAALDRLPDEPDENLC